MGRRPTSVTVLAIIGLGIALLALGGNCINGALLFVDPSSAFLKSSPSLQVYFTDPGLRRLLTIESLVGFAVNTFLVIGCIGSFPLKRWARGLTLNTAWAKIILALAQGIINIAYATPKIMAALTPGTPEYSGAQIGRYFAPVGIAFALAFPVCVVYFYTRPLVIDAFRGIFQASPTAFPVIHGPPPLPGEPPSPFP